MSIQPNPSLFHIGLATPMSSALQIILCVGFMLILNKNGMLKKVNYVIVMQHLFFILTNLRDNNLNLIPVRRNTYSNAVQAVLPALHKPWVGNRKLFNLHVAGQVTGRK